MRANIYYVVVPSATVLRNIGNDPANSIKASKYTIVGIILILVGICVLSYGILGLFASVSNVLIYGLWNHVIIIIAGGALIGLGLVMIIFGVLKKHGY